MRGAEIADPALRIARLLSPEGLRLYPLAVGACLPQLAAGPFDGVAPADLFRPDADLTALVAAFRANDPDGLTFHTPVRIEQGGADSVVLPSFTDRLVRGYRAATCRSATSSTRASTTSASSRPRPPTRRPTSPGACADVRAPTTARSAA